MVEYLFFGIAYAFAAVVQPGPLQAFLLSEVSRSGWRRTLPAALSPLLSDGPVALLALLVLNGLPAGFGRLLRLAGGLFLLYLAWAAFKDWRRSSLEAPAPKGPAPASLLKATVVNLLNPNPYLGWSLVLGPMVLKAWGESRVAVLVLLVSFYGTMVLGLALTILLLGTTRWLGPRGRRLLLLLSAIVLAALALYQVAVGLAAS